MRNISDVLIDVGLGAYDEIIAELYGEENVPNQRKRIIRALNEHEVEFGFGLDREARVFSAPARIEIAGNHTDHQLGNALSACICKDMLAIVTRNNDGVIRIKNGNMPLDCIAVYMNAKADPKEYSPLGDIIISDLDPYEHEEQKQIAIIRGIAGRFYLMGCRLGGFDCYITSDIPEKSGLCSETVFEVLIGEIMNHLYMDGKIPPEEIAQICQFAENYYFKKPGGLMNQLTTALGGTIWGDFYDIDQPFVKRIDFDFTNCGYTLCLVESRDPEKVYTDDFYLILGEMKSASNFFGKTALSRVEESEFLEYMADVRQRCGDRAVLSALHYFEEDKHAVRCSKCLMAKDFEGFYKEFKRSGKSSFMYLHNICTADNSDSQPMSVAFTYCHRLLEGKGAVRVHGGAVEAFVPNDMVEGFKNYTEKLFGAGRCHIMKIRQQGCVEIGGIYG